MKAAIYPALDMGLEVAEWIDRESGDMLYGGDLENCLDTLTESGARGRFDRTSGAQGPDRRAGKCGIFRGQNRYALHGREETGWEGYLQALESNAQSIAQAFEALEGTH